MTETTRPHDHDLHGACCGGEDRIDTGRRQTIDMLAKGGLAALLGGVAGALPQVARAAADDDVVRIGYLPITDATPLLVAHAQGYFEDEGLKVAKPTLIRSWSALIEGFAAGKFNLVHLLNPIPIWMRYNNKFPVKVMGWAHTNGSAIVVGKHTDIEDFKGLGGKQVAVPFWYSMHNIVLQYALRAAGVKAVIKPQGAKLAPDECNLQVLPPPEMPAALAARKIDAYIVAEPFNALGELKAGARMLRFTGDMWKNHPCCVICMNEQRVSANPEWTQKAMNALVRASVYASQNKEAVAKMLSKDGKGYLPAPAPVVVRGMTLYQDHKPYIESGAIKNWDAFHNGRIDFQPWPYPSATKFIVEQMNKTVVSGDDKFLDGLDPAFVAKDLVNYDHIRAACEKYPEWKKDPSVSGGDNPYVREEVIKL
ncbi:ABC transporter substrate-binding protein [Acidimangrovimonas sediminis]|uniref:ABC transporter substrate-binding protein n=1 Tax=Acidimangrovimonas sediminis TaxID=2056283 RepID=UPI0011AED546|nr:ABC transporter substrate-binding protein [Acidimangrovimonas sediminis]